MVGAAIHARYAVVLCERGIDEGVVAVEQVIRGMIVLNDVFHEADGLLEHGFAEVVSELREPHAIY